MNLIIADDHPVIRRGIKELLFLEFPFAFIEEVRDAETLLQKLAGQHFDLAIVDIIMQGKSGIEALKDIRVLYPHLPVLIMSIYTQAEYEIQALEAGASGYLSKDIIHEKLTEAVHKLMLGKKYMTTSITNELLNKLYYETEEPAQKKLSKRECEVFNLLAKGRSVSTIAGLLSLKISTISTFRLRIFEKMNLKSNASLIILAAQQKMSGI